MPQQPEALAAPELPPQAVAQPEVARPGGRGWRLVREAPEPDLPEPRDRRGAQRGMLILLAAGGLFWLGVAALVLVLVLRG